MSFGRRVVAAAAVAAVAAALTGCSLVQDLVNQGVDEVTGGQGDFSLGTVPEDFPAEVPLAEGDVILSAKPTPDSWAVTIRVADDAAAQAAADAVEEAGFTPLAEGTTVYENDTYHVALTWTAVEGGTGVAYVVNTR